LSQKQPGGILKLWVRGVSCSGKTTVSKILCQHFGLTHIQLDEYYWLPGWQARNTDEFAALVNQAIQSDNWLIDGNYNKLSEYTTINPDLMIWLNYPLYIVVWRCLKRTIWRIISRQTVCNGNRETLLHQFKKDGNMLYWVLITYRRQQNRLKENRLAGHNIVEVKHPKDVAKLIITTAHNHEHLPR
jgi:adenylate kinase family enzyme